MARGPPWRQRDGSSAEELALAPFLGGMMTGSSCSLGRAREGEEEDRRIKT